MFKRYVREKRTPKVPTCKRSMLTLHFDGKALQALGAKKMIYLPAVSGLRNGDKLDYSAERQKMAGQGPIPAGDYWIQPEELQQNAWYKLKKPRAAWGNYWIKIHPYPTTETYKRDGFFIHGGQTPGSAGCIDLSSNMNRFVESLTSELKGNGKCYIHFKVRYTR